MKKYEFKLQNLGERGPFEARNDELGLKLRLGSEGKADLGLET